MKILHLNTYTKTGGAALGTLFLHKALREHNIDSLLCTRDSDEQDYTVTPIEYSLSRFKRKHFARLSRRLYKKAKWQHYSTSLNSSLDIKKTILKYKPDILHLHWVTDGFVDFKSLMDVDIPIVITLRDCWFVTGGCHYTDGCSNFQSKCQKCPSLGSNNNFDLSTYEFNKRKKWLQKSNVHIVAISEWMSSIAKKSSLAPFTNISMIHNCIPLDEYFPLDRIESRKKLGLSKDATIYYFPSLHPWKDRRKGGKLLLKALDQLNKPNSVLICSDPQLEKLSNLTKSKLRIIGLGTAHSLEEMRLRYGASDLVIIPSLEEAFGKVTAEALACSRPTVAFNNTGADDIIRHKKTGYLAKNNCVEGLKSGIEWGLNNLSMDNHTELQEALLKKFSADTIAKKYIDLYKSLI